MDSLTVHYLAAELRTRWHERTVTACELDRDALTVFLAVQGSEAVCIDLAVREVAFYAAQARARSGRSHVTGWRVVDVCAPEDDRRLIVRFERPGKFRGSRTRRALLEVSVLPTARAAVLHLEDGHRLAALGSRMPAPSAPRPVLDGAEVQRAARAGDVEALLRGRWVGRELARWLLRHPRESAAIYAEACSLPPARPARCGGSLLPFPWCEDPQPAASLIEPRPREPSSPALAGSDRRARAVRRMRAELERAAAAPLLRRAADVLIAMGPTEPVPDELVLEDGTRLPLKRNTGDTPITVADHLYRQVRSMERALEVLPTRLAALEGEETRDLPAPPSQRAAGRAAPPARPYRTYRSSGGVDIWVGRGAQSNDRLTFGESAPSDVWLHAREAAGAHVVLRWQRVEPPPRRDLEEAAMLAAWHSKARGSRVVAVDWTRRKYVRKPRGSPPGVVVLQRARTIFVRPDAEVERKLRVGGG